MMNNCNDCIKQSKQNNVFTNNQYIVSIMLFVTFTYTSVQQYNK